MFIVGRHINGITLNPLEYLLGNDGEAMKFPVEDAAKKFLSDNGFTDEDMYCFTFESVEATSEGVVTA